MPGQPLGMPAVGSDPSPLRFSFLKQPTDPVKQDFLLFVSSNWLVGDFVHPGHRQGIFDPVVDQRSREFRFISLYETTREVSDNDNQTDLIAHR